MARAIAAPKKTNALYVDLERPVDLRRLQDADAFLRAQAGKLVVIDEIHRAPGLFEVLRGIIDERRRAGDRAGHFLLLGSAALDLMKQASETLAGRVEEDGFARDGHCAGSPATAIDRKMKARAGWEKI